MLNKMPHFMQPDGANGVHFPVRKLGKNRYPCSPHHQRGALGIPPPQQKVAISVPRDGARVEIPGPITSRGYVTEPRML
jgi:hypothetical protein